MDLVTVISFLVLYYLRPQEWPIGLGEVQFVRITMLAGLASLSLRPRGFSLRDLFRTPHDWAVLAFWLWIVLSSPTPWFTFKESVNLYVFYVVIVQTLYTVPRLNKFGGDEEGPPADEFIEPRDGVERLDDDDVEDVEVDGFLEGEPRRG